MGIYDIDRSIDEQHRIIATVGQVAPPFTDMEACRVRNGIPACLFATTGECKARVPRHFQAQSCVHENVVHGYCLLGMARMALVFEAARELVEAEDEHDAHFRGAVRIAMAGVHARMEG